MGHASREMGPPRDCWEFEPFIGRNFGDSEGGFRPFNLTKKNESTKRDILVKSSQNGTFSTKQNRNFPPKKGALETNTFMHLLRCYICYSFSHTSWFNAWTRHPRKYKKPFSTEPNLEEGHWKTTFLTQWIVMIQLSS